MNRLVVLATDFHAIHEHGSVQHGRRFVLRAASQPSDAVVLRAQLRLIRAELDDHVITAMLPGVGQDVCGLAAWAFERLSGPLPKLEWVSVAEDGEEGYVERTVR